MFSLWKLHEGKRCILSSSETIEGLSKSFESSLKTETRSLQDDGFRLVRVDDGDMGATLLGFKGDDLVPKTETVLAILPSADDARINGGLVDEAVVAIESRGFWVNHEFTEADKIRIERFLHKNSSPVTSGSVEDAVSVLFARDILAPGQFRICSKCGGRFTDGFFCHGDFLCWACRRSTFSDEEWFDACKQAEESGTGDVHWALCAAE